MHLDLDMGKYGLFVWGSYGAALLSLAAVVILSLRAHSARKAALAALTLAVEQARAEAKGAAEPQNPEPAAAHESGQKAAS